MSVERDLEKRVHELKRNGLPRHVAIIMDGNGRWATQRGLSRSRGHEAGAETVDHILRFSNQELKLAYLTLYAFSTENWNRSQEEVDALMSLLQRHIIEFLPELLEADARLHVAGDRSRLPATVREAVETALAATAHGRGPQLTIALSYGGRDEMVRVCRTLAEQAKQGVMEPSAIDEAMISRTLDTAGMPDPDLVIRTAGEYRLSNFLLWQCAYAELVFTDTLWPDFTTKEFVDILAEYGSRTRRFGGIPGGDNS